jgi:CubicO group peptidase (beta-lactamase class C family)
VGGVDFICCNTDAQALKNSSAGVKLQLGPGLGAGGKPERAREHAQGEDKTLLTRTRFGLGCMLDQPDVANATYGMGPRAFGHPGAGGSIGFADPERDVAFGFVTNNLGPFVLMDPRAQKLARLLADCL